MATFPIVTSKQKLVLAIAIINILFPSVAVSLRILSRRIAHRNLTSSDYCAIGATLFAVAYQSLSIASVVRCGVGYGHAVDINAKYGLEPIHLLFKIFLAVDAPWTISLSLSRTSMLLLYSKLFQNSYMVLASRITIIFMISWAVPTIVINFLICRPFSANWEPGETARCGNRMALFMSVTGLNLVSDILVVIMPLPHLYRLRLPKNTKVGLAIVMNLGILTSIVTILRLTYMHKLNFDDAPWTSPLLAVFSGLEPSMAATLCCVPLLKPLLGLGKRKRRPSRVVVVRNTLRTHQYDPAQADKLKLRGDRVSHTARVVVDEAEPRRVGVAAGSLRGGESEGSMYDWKGHAAGPEITVNRQWCVTREPGEWTQILGSR